MIPRAANGLPDVFLTFISFYSLTSPESVRWRLPPAPPISLAVELIFAHAAQL
jgi:hypothetical protein